MNHPWYKTTYTQSALGHSLTLRVPHDVFSTQRIDEGTQLLLEHLSSTSPASILDMGCGYGALGLPLAAHFPKSTVTMVDRDLLAVEWSKQNAVLNSLSNVTAIGSLGFETVTGTFDWILCNVPARIGEPFIRNLILEGQAHLNAGGDLRVVVINDLIPLVESRMKLISKGPRHSIFAIQKEESISFQDSKIPSSEDLYLRDRVEIGPLTLMRPFDLGGDDPRRIRHGLPVLFDALPRSMPATPFKAFSFRVGYGSIPLTLLHRWKNCTITAVDRDLLATTFLKLNATALGLNDRLEVREQFHVPDSLEATEKFRLMVGELAPSAGEAVARAEIEMVVNHLEKGGEALILCLDKIEKDWVQKIPLKPGISRFKVLSRDGYSVIRFS